MRKLTVRKITPRMSTLTGLGIATALALAPHAAADPATQAVQLGNIWYPHCAIQTDRVLCIGGSGWPQKVALVTASGQFQWTGGSSLGGDQPLSLTPGQSYSFLGWTVATTSTDMTFTDAATGHGMTVNGGNANPF
jgi:hypothetical protein